MNPKRPLKLGIRQQRGFTLVEALVALLVLSIGLLGVAAMQLSSLRANNGAFQRSQATFLAYDIADRMRANRDAALAGAYDFAYGTPMPPSDGTVAERDLFAWRTRLATTLPVGKVPNGSTDPLAGQPDASVTRVGRVFTINVRWDDSKGAETMLVFTMRTRL